MYHSKPGVFDGRNHVMGPDVMSNNFHDGQRQLQDQFDTRRLAEHCVAKLVRDTINEKQKAFIESADMFFLATADE